MTPPVAPTPPDGDDRRGVRHSQQQSSPAPTTSNDSNQPTTRILQQALPQLTQWLQDVQTHPQIVRVQQELRRQSSSSSSATRDERNEDLPDESVALLHGEPQAWTTQPPGIQTSTSSMTSSSRRRGQHATAMEVAPAFEIRIDPLAMSTPTGEDTPGPDPTMTSSESRAASRSVSPRSTISDDDTASSQHEDPSTMEQLQTLLRRGHHALPFVALFLIYFAYQHTTGIIVFAIGTLAIMGLDQRVRTQIALKECASRIHLVGIMVMCGLDVLAICGINGDPNPLHHLTRRVHASTESTNGMFWDVIWLVLVNDFIVRLTSLALKAGVALIRSDRWLLCGWRRPVVAVGSPQSPAPACDDTESEPATTRPRKASSRANVTFYRRKRKLYGLIELVSIFVRTVLAGIPWCSYYQLCSSKFVGDVFTFTYILIKGVVLSMQGRRILATARSLCSLGLEHATYVTAQDLAEAGTPDCSICYEAMYQPVRLGCSHMFCEECVMEWFDRERSCPLCRASILPPSAADGTPAAEPKPQFLDGSTSLFPQLL